MKDFNQSSKDSVTAIMAFASPVLILLMVLAGVFISNTAASAQESPESTRITADLQEDYFISDNRLAQAGDRLQSRSEIEVDTEGETMNSCNNVYLNDNLRIDFDNDRVEVLKLQSFLKTFAGYEGVALSGTFDTETLAAVKAFQTRYAEDVLTPWGYQPDEATGYVYITTKQKINEIYCDEQFMLSRQQQTEIREYREKLNNWRAQGANFDTPQYLAEYYGYTVGNQASSNTGNTVTVTETSSEETATTATTATTSEDDSRGFFSWLFGGNNTGETDDAATTSTTSEEEAATTSDSDNETSTTADEAATTTTSTTSATTATASVDQMAAGVYTGVNSVIDFLLSTTFLLIVLVILILLLIATLIEKGDETNDSAEGDVDTDEEATEAAETMTDEESLDSTVAFGDISDEGDLEMVEETDDIDETTDDEEEEK